MSGTCRENEVERLRGELSALAGLSDDQARTMPPEFYHSKGLLDLEKEHLFAAQWACVGHQGEIPDAGDYFTTEMADEPLLVTRAKDGRIRVLSNVCRHRGNVVAEGRGNRRRFVCQYHGWTYSEDGGLIGAPFMDRVEGFDKANCRLPDLKTEVWNGFIFVNLDGAAEPLSPQLAGLDAHLANYHPGERHLIHVEEDIWQANWKCLVENFIEGYHLSTTHAKTLHPVTPTRLCEKYPGNDAYTGYFAYYDPTYPERGPFHPDLTEDERRRSVMGVIYPGMLFGVGTDFALFVLVRPCGVDRVALRWMVTGQDPDPELAGAKHYVELCRNFNAEDREKLETLHLGLKSRYLETGPLAHADYEGTIWDFLKHIAGRLGADKPLNGA